MSKANQFLNEVVEAYLLKRNRSIHWTRSRAYKKNDQAHVEQKNFTHVRQLLGYGRFGDLNLKVMVDDLYEHAWLPLRNHFTPVMKLIEKQRIGSQVKKKYDKPMTPCDRLLGCSKVSDTIKAELRTKRAGLDPITLSEDIEQRLKAIFEIVEWIEEERREEMSRAGENQKEESGKEPVAAPVGMVCVTAQVAAAPCASTPTIPPENLVKTPPITHKTTKRRVS